MIIHKFKKSISMILILTFTSTIIPCNATNLVAVNGSKPIIPTFTPVPRPIIESEKNISEDFSVQSINSKVNDMIKTQNNKTKLKKNLSGTCGQDDDNVVWNLNTDSGELTILGSGNMKNYEYDKTPWGSYRDKIKTLTIGNEVASIGTKAFYNCKALESVTISESVKVIGSYAFSKCSTLECIKFEGIEVPKHGKHVFYKCDKLNKINVPAKYEGSTFCGNKVQKNTNFGFTNAETNNKEFWADVSILAGIVSGVISIIGSLCKMVANRIKKVQQNRHLQNNIIP